MNRLPETCSRCGSAALVQVPAGASSTILVCATCGNGRDLVPLRGRRKGARRGAARAKKKR